MSKRNRKRSRVIGRDKLEAFLAGVRVHGKVVERTESGDACPKHPRIKLRSFFFDLLCVDEDIYSCEDPDCDHTESSVEEIVQVCNGNLHKIGILINNRGCKREI